MERTRFLTLLIIALLVLNMGTLAYLVFAGRKQSPLPNGPGGPAAFIIEKLGFDEQQQQAFEELKHQHRRGMNEKQDSIRALHEQLFDLLKTDTPDMARADSIAAVIALRKKEADLFTFNHFLQVRLLCNDDQKKLFDRFINDIQSAITSPGPMHRPPPGRRP